MLDNTALFRALAKIADEKNGSAVPTAVLKRRIKTSSQNYRLYSIHARQILSDITELRDLVLDKRKEYILCSNAFSLYGAQRFMSNEDRKKFDKETDLAVKQCTKLIKDLEIQITSDRQLRADDEYMHIMMVVNMLNLYLKEVLAIISQLREIYLRKTRQIRKICRLANLVDMYGAQLADAQREEEAKEEKLAKMKLELEANERRQKKVIEQKEKQEENKTSLSPLLMPKKEVFEMEPSKDGWDEADEIPDILDQPEMIEEISAQNISQEDGWSDAVIDLNLDSIDESPIGKKSEMPHKKTRKRIQFEAEPIETLPAAYEPMNKAEQTQLVEENRKIFDKFSATDSELERIERHMTEIQRLQNMFAEKISEQEQNIDVIHSRIVYTLDNLEQANDYIREAIKNQANRRVIMIFCLLVLTFTLLFLDWYNH